MQKNVCLRLPCAIYITIFFLLSICPGGMTALAQNDSSTVTIRQILDAHNAYRTDVGVPALSWSDELAEYAQNWSNELVVNRGCKMQHRPYDENDPWKQKYGENIYMAGGTGWTPTVLDAIADWATEKKDFDFDKKDCKDGGGCGHYTQMIWRNTTQVGCGTATCPNGNVIVVCNYNPAGNVSGEAPY